MINFSENATGVAGKMKAFVLTIAGVVLMAGSLAAQQGHPLVGSWHGDWGVAGSEERLDLTVIMDWDGTTVTGIVNPVTDRARLENARLDSSNWTVRFEVDVADISGATRHCVANGTLDRLGSDRRTLTGTWTCGNLAAEFILTRDRDY
jgi:hypothetical protein